MIFLELFLTFLKIGAVSFGGGYAMISLIREDCLANGWLGEEELLNFIAVAESTPGPIAVNMATFVGSSQGGILGALVATLGVVLPSFIVIILIASILTKVLKYAGVKATLQGIRPAIVGMIMATFFTMLLSVIFSIKTYKSTLSVDLREIAIFVLIGAVFFGYKGWKKAISPISLILISAIMGVIMFGV